MASAVGPWELDKWNMLYGHFNVTETLAEADSIFFNIERTRPGVNLLIDDITIRPTLYGCQMPVYNRDFETGDTRFWRTIGNTKIAIYQPGYDSNYALRTTLRDEFWGSMTQDLNKDCLVEGDRFTVSAMLLLLDKNDDVYECDLSAVWGDISTNLNDSCPIMSLRIASGAVITDLDIGTIPDQSKSSDWDSIYGEFDVTASMVEADLVSIHFTKLKPEINIVVDNLSVTKIENNETGLVSNGDFSVGDVRYYNVWSGGAIHIAGGGYGGTEDYSMIVRDRTSEEHGVNHEIDNTLLIAEDVYKISCQIFLLEEDLMTFFSCNPMATSGDARCPTLSLRSQNIGTVPLTRVVASTPLAFKVGEWNEFSSIFQFLEVEIQADSLYLIINNAPKDVVMVIDNVDLYKPNFASDMPSSQPSISLKPSSAPRAASTIPPTQFNSTSQ